MKNYCFYRNLGIVLFVALLAGCAESPEIAAQASMAMPHAAPRSLVTATNPAQSGTDDAALASDGVTLVPGSSTDSLSQAETPVEDASGAHKARFSQAGVASWYGKVFQGRRTASGERYDARALTAAHRTLPLGSYVRVTAVGSDRSVVVRINDRGPFTRGRVIDLSYAAAAALGLSRAGTLLVNIESVGKNAAGS